MEALGNDPEVSYPALEMGVYRHFKRVMHARNILVGPDDCHFHLRILDWPNVSLKMLKAHLIGRLISVSGTVIRASGIKPRVQSLSFRCPRCERSAMHTLEDGKFSQPVSCATPNCKSKKFEPDLERAVSVDWQTIRVQENIKGFSESGRMPRMIEVELLDDLADSCVPGDTVTVVGIVKRESADRVAVMKAKNKAVYYIYLEAKSVVNTKQPTAGLGGARVATDDFDAAELQAIRRIAQSNDVFKNIVHSLCPSIYGHELVKAGLCLALFGGTQRKLGGGTVRIRGDPHVLIVGDPGLGKSQMLRAISSVAPRGVYVCGSYSSSSGLTVTLMKEAGTGDFVLEAGALVLADQGVCCIDEFDKMPNEHQSLLEAMEQQCISVAKAGIVCTLMARTSVIAAANPVGGHYDRAKTIAENLKMAPALLSRFDLIFILLDKPDESIDKRLSEHVLALHGNITHNAKDAQKKEEEGFIVWQSQPIRGASQQVVSDAGNKLFDRLKIRTVESLDLIPPKALRKYVSYARRYVHPRLSDAACDVLKRFYLQIRQKHTTHDSVPITNRQLESLIRLSEARARLELRDVVTERDAQDVVEMMQECMFSSWEDHFGNLDPRRATGMSKANLVQCFIGELKKRKDASKRSLFPREELRQIASNLGILQYIDDFYVFLDSINNAGYIMKRKDGYELGM